MINAAGEPGWVLKESRRALKSWAAFAGLAAPLRHTLAPEELNVHHPLLGRRGSCSKRRGL